MLSIPVYGGPVDGGLVNVPTVGGKPPAVVFTRRRPSDGGWFAGQHQSEPRLRVHWSPAPTDFLRTRYLYSESRLAYVHDGLVTADVGSI